MDRNLTPIKKVPRTLLSQAQYDSARCSACQGLHKSFSCNRFNKMSVERYNVIKQQKRFFTCFAAHNRQQCTSSKQYRQCGSKRHNTLLYNEDFIISTLSASVKLTQSSSHVLLHMLQIRYLTSPQRPFVVMLSNAVNEYVLLSTVKILIEGAFGHRQTVRCVLESGSQRSIITSECVERLGVNKH